MHNGVLITNKYLMNEKFSTLIEGFVHASKLYKINLECKNNEEAYELLFEPIHYDFILFYDKDIKLAKGLESIGYKLFNKSTSIEICDDKYLTYKELEGKIRQAKTMFSPLIYYGNLSCDYDLINKIEKNFQYPFIIKSCHGSFGFQVYKIDNNEQLIKCLIKLETTPFIIQEYISSSFGKDLRLQVVGNDVVCAMKRINENGDFRANITNGGIAYNHIPSASQVDMAISATKILKLDFAGIDLLFDENGEPIFCEANSNAHIETIGKISNINVYNKIIEYIVNCIRNTD